MTHPPVRRDVLALDVGGANIKAADGTGWTHTEPFAMWRDALRLADVLTRIARDVGPRRIVATMTGEIADCFAGRVEGVSHIVGALAAAAEASGCGSPGIYRVDGRIVSPDDVATDPLSVAASNWHAVARLAASLVPHARALLVDIGSTTCDIVPLAGGRPAPDRQYADHYVGAAIGLAKRAVKDALRVGAVGPDGAPGIEIRSGAGPNLLAQV